MRRLQFNRIWEQALGTSLYIILVVSIVGLFFGVCYYVYKSRHKIKQQSDIFFDAKKPVNYGNVFVAVVLAVVALIVCGIVFGDSKAKNRKVSFVEPKRKIYTLNLADGRVITYEGFETK
jgi:ABC-type enterochelin transport system permease subunit